jgi:hypothetical protein
LRVESRYDDNIFQQPRGTADVATLIRPGLTFDGRSETQSLEFRARRTFITYSTPQQMAPYTEIAALDYAGRWSEATSLTLEGHYARSRDPVNLQPVTVPDLGAIANGYAAGHAEAWRGEIMGRYNHWTYKRPGLAPGESRFWGASLFPHRSGAGVWLVSYHANELEIDNRTAVASGVVTAGWRRSHSERLRSEVRIGAANVNYEDGTPDERKLAGVVDVSATFRTWESPTTLRARLAEDITWTADIGLSRAWRMVGASVKWERLLDVEGGLYRDPTVTERWSFGLDDTLGSGKILALRGSHGRTEPLLLQGTRADVYRASATFTVPVLSWLNQQTQYDFIQQSGRDSSAGVDFRRSRVGISFTALLR